MEDKGEEDRVLLLLSDKDSRVRKKFRILNVLEVFYAYRKDS